MTDIPKKYKVKKGRSVTCRNGVAHADAVLTIANFNGADIEAKQKIIDTFLEIGAIEEVQLTGEEKKAIADAKERAEAKLKELEKLKEEEAKAKEEEKQKPKSKK